MQTKVEDHSAEFLEAMKKQVALGLKAIGQEAEGYAKDNCPVDTGLLRNSITYATSGEAPAISSYSSDDGSKSGSYSGTAPKGDGLSVYIGTNVEYAEEQEIGDRIKHKTGGAHFLRNAAADHGDHYKEIMRAALDT